MNRIEQLTKPLGWFLALLLAALAAGAGCGGSGTGDIGNANKVSNGSVSTTSSGIITGFGSVYVNGVKYNTTGTSVSIDGSSGMESQLKVGMVVKVDGTINSDGLTGSANSIKFYADVKGPISAKNMAANTLTVLGQTISVDGATVFAGVAGLSALAVNDIVEVSGFRNASGIVASRIEKKTLGNSSGNIQVKGIISNLDTTAKTFSLGALSVNYGGLTALPALRDGLLVEVKATTAATPLIATRIEVEDTLEDTKGAEGKKVEVEGYISSFSDIASDFNVAGQAVHVSNNTRYEHGAEIDLRDGARIEAEGTLTNGILVVSKISVKQSNSIKVNHEVEGPVVAIDATSITVSGQKFAFNNLTQMEDKTGAQPKLNIGNISGVIAVGDRVEVRGFKNSAGDLVATRIERKGNEVASSEGAT